MLLCFLLLRPPLLQLSCPSPKAKMRQPASQPYDGKATRSGATNASPNPKKINSFSHQAQHGGVWRLLPQGFASQPRKSLAARAIATTNHKPRMMHSLHFPCKLNTNKLVLCHKNGTHAISSQGNRGLFERQPGPGRNRKHRNKLNQWHVCYDSQQKPGPFPRVNTLNASDMSCKK